MTVLGIDLSRWNGKWDAEKAKKAGVGFVIIKAGQGLTRDRLFKVNRQKAKDAGLLYGLYHYQDWSETGADQGEFFLDQTQGDIGQLPPDADYEERQGAPHKANGEPDPVKATAELSAFLLAVSVLCAHSMIYSSPGYWEEFGTNDPKWLEHPLHLADYTPPADVPLPWKGYAIWQKTAKGKGSLYGCEAGDVDLDEFPGTLEELLTFGATGQLPAIPVPAGKVYTVIAQQLNVRAGPGTSYRVIGSKLHGDQVLVFESRDGWARISPQQALTEWVSARYIAEVR